MTSKNKESVMTKSVPRYGFRKLTVGLAGVALSTALALANPTTNEVKADTIPDDPDTVNTQPSGEKAVQAELNDAAKQAVPEPVKAATHHAAAALSAKSAKAKPKDEVPDDPTAKQAVNKQATSQTKQAASQAAASEPATNTGNATTTQSKQTDTNSIPNITKSKTAKTGLDDDQVPDITTDKDTKTVSSGNSVTDQVKPTISNYANESDASDPKHNKYINRTITWKVKRKDGSFSDITHVVQTVRFGQLWEDSGNGIVYTPWESDPRTVAFDPYSNTKMLTELKGTIGTGAGKISQEDYNSIEAMFTSGNYTISADGAPESNKIAPLSSDTSFDIILTPKDVAKNVKVVVIYRDLDDGGKALSSKNYATTTSDSGSSIDASADYNASVADYLSKGYTHNVNDDTLPNGGKINIPATADAQDAYTYYVGLRHKIIEYGPGENNPHTNQNDDANLVKTVTQTIHYTGTPSPIADNVQNITFTRRGITDMVTGKTTYKDWDKASDQYQDVTSPTVSGYFPDQDVIKGTKVTPTSSNTVKTVTYAPDDQMRDAIVHYRYESWDSNKEVFPDKNRKIAATIDSNGNWKYDKDVFNQDIIAKDGYTATVVKTNVQGGKLHAWIVYVKNPANETVIHFLDQDNSNKPIDKVSSITANNIIGKPIDKPAGVDEILDKLDKLGYELVSNPFDTPTTAIDGKQDLNYILKHKKVAVNPITNRKETVHFVDEQGNKLAPDKTQSASFTHHGETDLVTGETTWTGWSANQTTNPVDVPVVNGYVTDTKRIAGQVLTPDQDIDITVRYRKIGKIVPVDENGTVIQGASQPVYVNDPTDPTKVQPNQNVPNVPGYTPDSPTVTPTDPTKDTPVKYHQTGPTEHTSLGIVVHDDDTNQDLNDYHWTSGSVNPGDKVGYDWAAAKQKLIDHGYVITKEPAIPDRYGKTAQVVTIHVKHGQVHVNPDKPQTPGGKINKGDGRWPSKSAYERYHKYTVHFVDKNGKKIAPDQVQTMRFGRDLIIDTVTGKILNPDAKWTPKNSTYEGVKAMSINGYRLNGKSLNGVALVNGVLPGAKAVDSDISDSIVYDAATAPAPRRPQSKPVANTPAPAQPAPVPNQPKVQKASVLPQTGSVTDSNQAAAMGVIGIAMMLLTLGLKPKKRDNE